MGLAHPEIRYLAILLQKWLSDYKYNSLAKNTPLGVQNLHTVKSRLSERRLSETTGLFEDDGQSRLFSLLSIAKKTTNYSNFGYPKNSIFRNDSSVPIEEVAIKLPFKIRSPKATHGDHDFFVWPSSIYTPE